MRRNTLVKYVLLFVLGTLLGFGTACGNSIPAAEYPESAEPVEEPMDVVLKITGSEGGAYTVRAETWEEGDLGEQIGTIFGAGKSDYEGVLGTKLTQYRFDMDDGVWADRHGDLQWDDIKINVDKSGEWEGKIYAKLFVNDELVDCGNTDSNTAIRFVWEPPDGSLGFWGRFFCGRYPGF